MDRRSFIKLTAVTSGTAALAACGNPDHELIRFVPDEDIVPGVATWKPGVCTVCAAGCGLTVRVMDADQEVVRDGVAGVKRIYAAKKLEGNPAHPVNRGGLCGRGQAAIQVTYHPDRITQPLKRVGERGTGKYEAISWDEAIGQVVARLDELAAGNRQAVSFLTRPGRSHRAELIDRFLTGYGAPPAVVDEFFGETVLRQANALSFGRHQLPTFDLANARFVLSFGADFLGTWNSPVAQAAAYGQMRQGRPGIRGAFVQVEPRMSQTGANADEWVPATSGSEGVLAFAIARAIIDAGLRPAARLGAAAAVFDRWRATPEAEPEAVAAATGISAARIERLARAFVDQSPSVAIVGGAPLTLSNGLFTALAVNALNTLNGSVGTPGGLYFTPQVRLGPSAAADPALSGAGGPLDAAQLLFLDGVNPVHLQSAEVNVAEALAKVPMIVSFGQFLDETSAYADLILPDHSFLEQWTDAIPESGSLGAVITVAPPVMAPLYQTRATTDLLLEIGRRLATPVDLGWQTFEEMLAATFATLPPATEGGDAWAEAQEQGGWWGTLPAGLTVAPAAQSAPGPGVDPGASAAQLDGDASQYPLQLIAYPSSMFLDGSLAHLPWMQETPDPITSAMWSSWIEINPATAQKMGVATGDLVDVASAHASLRTAAVITPGIAPGVVAMPMGQGHTMFTRVATGRGENPARLLSGRAWAATRVTVSRAGDPDGRLILFAGGDRDHDGAHEYGHAGRG